MKANTLISFILLFAFLLLPDEAMAQRRRRGVSSVDMPGSDSINFTIPRDSIGNDTLKRETVVADTVPASPKKQPLDAPVFYEANDSIVFEQGGYAHLYGQGKVNYQNIELTAEIITMNMDSSTVYARGVEDSLGVKTGIPIFKDGETPYETNTIRYNFKSKRGLISNVVTQQGEGYVVGNNAKKGANDELFMINGRYTTCDHHDHPHFYLQLTRAKVRPKKNVVTGPAYLVVEDVPLPIAVPFFFFPFSSSYSSGFIMPSYMDDSNRGFGLSNGGYYFAISDKMDLKVLGEIFTKGSWALSLESNYAKRYKYTGSFQGSYQITKLGEKNMPDYSETKDMKIMWSHRQDPKANPNSTFSASVNYTTSSYERNSINNIYNPNLMAQSTKTSSVSYSRSFPDQKLTISGTMNIAQSLRDSSISVTLPDMNISLSRIFPFKRKNAVGGEKWYEKISMSYTGRLTNSIKTKDDQLFNSNLIKDWTNGMNHSIPISATFTLFNYFNITPSVNYTERWYSRKVLKEYDQDESRLVATDTVYGFHRVYNYNASLGINTKLYGTYQPIFAFAKKKDVTIRHVFTPTVSLSAAPDFGASRYGYHKDVTYTDRNGEEQVATYSPYEGNSFGVPGRGKQGNISFDITNNLEMKMRSSKDSTKMTKISLIDELGASLSYNMAAKERPWSNLNTRLRMKFSKSYTFNMNATWKTYGYELDKNGKVVSSNKTEWSRGRFGIFQGYSTSFQYTLNNDTWKKLKAKLRGEKTEDEETSPESDTEENETSEDELNMSSRPKEKAVANEDGYQAFAMPWSLNLNYGVTIAEDQSKEINYKTMRYPYSLRHTFNCSGNIKLSNKWAVSFNSGYDFVAKEITQTTFNISRDLHCWTMTATLSPFGRWKTYNFTIRASASILQDLKWEQRSQTQSNIQWY
ncbi:putative LPS assembly protein LptD [Bacteroides sp. 519]|uniref:putative LPS assembly protein LptD n=1 Tax=Bacteroides sp. 519 TaxID=2302937 RepID=UPI0013D11A0B|nr:putative LPS assembly protein LptD [Bacteroides sp. 519]NDV57764.1 LPS-assembly protein LptD [Bacteroides sp. 519]